MKYRVTAFFVLVSLLATLLAGCTGMPAPVADESDRPAQDSVSGESDSDIVAFRPVDCGVQAQGSYAFPFLGMTLRLPEALLSRVDSRAVFVFTLEDYTAEGEISYALLRFSLPTQAQQQEEGMSVDIFSWEEALPKLGAIGVYLKEQTASLDALTGCDSHQKLGQSEDGRYEYYLSTHSAADADCVALLEQTELTLSPMHVLDLSLGYTAFSEDRLDGVQNVGSFETTDVFGNAVTQAVFADYDLTLVNIFATWCNPCVQEMPELEKLRQSYADKGIRLGIVAVVMDVNTATGIDEDALARAQALSERSGAQFPMILPDAGGMNGRLVGIAAYPESFFVDSAGNIVSEPYVGANSLAGWTQIVEAELANLNG